MTRQAPQSAARRGKWPNPEGFGIYVHYPLCTRRCGYCDFATVESSNFPHFEYAALLLQEAGRRQADYQGWPLETIYIGGGSPSLWPSAAVSTLVEGLLRHFRCASEVEVTVEVNPGDVTEAQLRQLREGGVNRLSIGVQSLDDAYLKRLTRLHDAACARQAVAFARSAGFDNLSCDLICGAGDESEAHHLEQIEALAGLSPSHISVYSLTLSPAAPLAQAGLVPLEDDRMADLLESGRRALTRQGYHQYEVSNYCHDGRVSRHNLLVWQGRPYLGLGASAHSMTVGDDETGCYNVRVANPAFRRYIEAHRYEPRFGATALVAAHVERIDASSARHEMMMLGLRTSAGVQRAAYRRRFGSDCVDDYAVCLRRLEKAQLVAISGHAVAPTERGIFFADTLALELAS